MEKGFKNRVMEVIPHTDKAVIISFLFIGVSILICVLGCFANPFIETIEMVIG